MAQGMQIGKPDFCRVRDPLPIFGYGIGATGCAIDIENTNALLESFPPPGPTAALAGPADVPESVTVDSGSQIACAATFAQAA